MTAYELVSQAKNSLSKMKDELAQHRETSKVADSKATCARTVLEAYAGQVRAVCGMLAAATGRSETEILKSVGLAPKTPLVSVEVPNELKTTFGERGRQG